MNALALLLMTQSSSNVTQFLGKCHAFVIVRADSRVECRI